MKTIYWIAALGALFVTGCAGQGVNVRDVFLPQAGTIQLKVETADASIQSVEFLVDEVSVGRDDNGADGWIWPFDSTKVADGIHSVKAIADNGKELLHNSLLIQNGSAPATPATPAE